MTATETQFSDKNLIEKISQSIGELPPSPTVVSRVMGLTSDLNSNVEELGDVLAADAALTAKVLRLSNSSFYGRSREVSSLREAILILGFYTLRSLVIATTTHSLYRSKENPEGSVKLWEHSLASALAARIAADRIAHPEVEDIFISGLLHDIGKLILRRKLGSLVDELQAESLQNGFNHLDAERKKLGFTHADLGAAVLERWCLPARLVEGVKLHHISTFETPKNGGAPIHAVVNFGNELAKTVGASSYPDPAGESFDTLRESLEQLPLVSYYNINGETIEEIELELKERFAEEKQIYEEG